ncbi:hypothetical protein ACFJGW_12530 [Burkholderiaceae bacterium UC74_6]
MFVICSTTRVRAKYGSSGEKVLKAVGRLGEVVDVTGQSPEGIRAQIAKLGAGPACLIGGYDLIPPFMRPNPTYGQSHDDDKDIPTDAPYGAAPGKAVEEYAPSRAVSRIPDDATPDAATFLAMLAHQVAAPKTATPAGSFEEAADEFDGAANFVHGAIPGATTGAKGKPRLSPPAKVADAGLTAKISGKGRFHILLHGANFDPDWDSLWGHSSDTNAEFVRALSAQLFDLCDLRGAVVSFSSCYSAMLDIAPATEGARTSKNQVALACLSHGAKVVFGATRSNWIATAGDFNAFGPALMALVWKQLGKGKPAAEALRLAKAAYLKEALSQNTSDQKYVLKTVLQAQCYGHAEATL